MSGTVPPWIVPARQLMYNVHRWLSSNGGHEEKASVKCRPVAVTLTGLLAMVFVLAACRIGPPEVSHSVAGRGDCRSCHETGVGDAPRFPQDHRIRGNNSCDDCHFIRR